MAVDRKALLNASARISAAFLLRNGPSSTALAPHSAGLCHAAAAGPTPAPLPPSCTRTASTQAPSSSRSSPQSSSSATAGPTQPAAAPAPSAVLQGAQATAGTWLTKLRTALFPIPAASPASSAPAAAQAPSTSPQQHLIPSSPMSANLQRLRAKEAAMSQQASADPFIPLSPDAEAFSGMMFKVSMVMITIPLAMWFVSNYLLVTLCIKGLRSPDPVLVKLSLARVQLYIFTEALAAWFERDDGVVVLVSLLGHQAVLGNPVVFLQCLATITHLMRFEETRSALLLGMVTERLKKALDQGWVASEAVDEARQVQKALEAMKQLHMEQMFGVEEGGSSEAAPAG